MRIASLLKGIFFSLIFLQVAPLLFNNVIKQYTEYFEVKTSVGLLHLKHSVNDSSIPLKTLTNFFSDHDIKAIVVWINNLDITPSSAQIIAQEIMHLKQQKSKPVITFCENNCALWSYYLTCATDYIIAPPATIINLEHKKLTSDPKLVDNLDRQFIDFAIKQRKKLTEANRDQWAGKMFTGLQATTLGLIDQTGSVVDVVHALKSMSLIEGEIKWNIAKEELPFSFTQLFQQVAHLFE